MGLRYGPDSYGRQQLRIYIGTEIRPRLLREAAAKNIPQWGEP